MSYKYRLGQKNKLGLDFKFQGAFDSVTRLTFLLNACFSPPINF